MIPKSLILSFLALQPGMSPAPGANDVIVLSDATTASVLPGWGARGSGDKTADFSTYPLGKWDPETPVNGILEFNTPTNTPWLYSRRTTFPNVPPAPDNLDHVLGGSPENQRLQVTFNDKSRNNTRLSLIYEHNGLAVPADITTRLTDGELTKYQSDHLNANDWNDILYVDFFKRFDVLVDKPKSGGKLLLAMVTYNDDGKETKEL